MKGKERVERVAGFEKSDELFYNESINILQPATLSTLSTLSTLNTLLLFYILHTILQSLLCNLHYIGLFFLFSSSVVLNFVTKKMDSLHMSFVSIPK